MLNNTGIVTINVAAKALIVSPNGQVLILREAPPGKHHTNVKVGLYGLPGGVIGPGEPFEEGLRREIHEETGLEVTPEYPLQVGEWWPAHNGATRHIVAVFMLCHTASATAQISTEHDDAQWIDPRERHRYPMMEPDCFVIDRYAELT